MNTTVNQPWESSGPALLAQAPAPGGNRDLGPMFLWIVVLLLIVTAGGLGIMWFRRSVLAKDNPDQAEAGLMDSLRALRNEGKISTEEYDAMRQAMVRKAASRHATPPGVQPRRASSRTGPDQTRSSG